MTDQPPPVAPFDELPRIAQVTLLLLTVAVAALCVRLWPDWRHNPDMSHGLLMPVVFVLLVAEARRSPGCFLRNGTRVRLGVAALLALALGALIASGLYAASVDWSHPLVNFSLTAALVCFLGAGLLVLSSDGTRAVPFNWTAVIAIVLWTLCTPVPPGTYSRLTLTLQLWVTEAVLQSVHLVGIPAVRHGNIIELAHTTVGVEEACSGIRSLISCVFAGLFFSATLIHRAWARALIIVLSVPLALGMNFLRSLTLTLLSNHGVDISGLWHDATGFAVLGVTALLLAALALLLERRAGATAAIGPKSGSSPSSLPRGQFFALVSALGVAAILVFVSVVNTRASVRQDSPVPDLLALLPATAAGWQVSTSGDLYQFSDVLQTDHLAQRIYKRRAPDGSVVEVILYAAYWHPGQAPVSLVASHTPDACWPGSGWTAIKVNQTRVALTNPERTMPEAEYREFTFNGFPQYVWYWHLYDGRPITYRDPYSPIELLRIAVQYGFRHDGDQLFIRLSSNRPWPELAQEPLLEDFFRRVKQVGL